MKAFIILTLTTLIIHIAFAGHPYKGKAGLVTSEFIYQQKDVQFPSCHASTIVETPEGLIAAWFGGTEERAPDVCIYTSTKIDGKWGTPTMVADGIQEGKQYPCWNPVLFRKDDGTVVLYYKVGPTPREWWGLYKTSADNGKTWSAATHIPNNLLGPIKNKPVRLPNGKILYPTSFETAEKWNSYLETSDQELKNWERINLDNSTYQTIQPTILFHKNGNMQLLFRSKNKAIIESWSKNNGQTWSALTPTSLPNNNSGIDAVTLKNGDQALIFNPITKDRNKLGIALSKDGINWEAAVLLEDDPDPKAEYSYPAIIQAKDGLIHVTYTWNRQTIKHAVINPSKLKTKPILNGEWPKSKLNKS
jgi:alpha-L-fucosidase